MKVTLNNGKIYDIYPTDLIGSGGEAEIFKIYPGHVFKYFKPSTHPDYVMSPDDQMGAQLRIQEHQTKLKQFPTGLPSSVISPIHLGYSKNKIIGYVMKMVKHAEALLRYSEKSYRVKINVDNLIHPAMKELHTIVDTIHMNKVVIGDFTDLNILLQNGKIFLIDADSMQFGSFLCRLYTERFVDPLLCDSSAKYPILTKPHNQNSDWYAFAIMLMQICLFVGPYGGIYKPVRHKDRILHSQRPLKNITIFHPDIIYPKPARHYSVLPDDLLQQFYKIFEQNQRGIFPEQLLQINWTTCPDCGIQHARTSCPQCKKLHPIQIKQLIRIKGKIVATQIFSTKGIIHYACLTDRIRWVFFEGNKLYRENRCEIPYNQVKSIQRIRILKDRTYIVDRSNLSVYNHSAQEEFTPMDYCHQVPLIDTNSTDCYQISGDQLFQIKQPVNRFIGTVLANQTQFWVGEEFGFGFYQVGQINVGFVFDTQIGRLNDAVKLPRLTGQLVKATCLFSKTLCWFLTLSSYKGKILYRCLLINAKGQILYEENSNDPNTWISVGSKGTAYGNMFFVPSDVGIIRLDYENGIISKIREYDDTEPWIDSNTQLFIQHSEIYAITEHNITKLNFN